MAVHINVVYIYIACITFDKCLTSLTFPTQGFSVEGPSQAKIECDDKGDGSCDVRYWPQEPGEYAVHVLCNNEDIKLSPFMAEIKAAPKDFHPEKVTSMPWGTHIVVQCVTTFLY